MGRKCELPALGGVNTDGMGDWVREETGEGETLIERKGCIRAPEDAFAASSANDTFALADMEELGDDPSREDEGMNQDLVGG